MRTFKWTILAVLMALAILAPGLCQAFEPCAIQLMPRYFYSGFEYGYMGGFVWQPPSAWAAVTDEYNNHVCEVSDLGCSTWAQSWVTSGVMWDNITFQASVKFKEGDDCPTAGLIYRAHWTSGSPQLFQFYQFVLEGYDTASLMKWDGAAFSRIESVPFVFQADRWYVLRVNAVGADHVAYVNGQPVLQWTDADYVRGSAGPTAKGVRAWFDNVVCLVGMNFTLFALN